MSSNGVKVSIGAVDLEIAVRHLMQDVDNLDEESFSATLRLTAALAGVSDTTFLVSYRIKWAAGMSPQHTGMEKIKAIKLVREFEGMSLKDAKDAVEGNIWLGPVTMNVIDKVIKGPVIAAGLELEINQ